MKKVLIGILALVMVLGLVGCGNKYSEEEVQEALVGTWTIVTKDGLSENNIGWSFYEDGTASSYAFGPGSEGTYKIKGDSIELLYNNGKTALFKYSFDEGEFKIKTDTAEWWNLRKQMPATNNE